MHRHIPPVVDLLPAELVPVVPAEVDDESVPEVVVLLPVELPVLLDVDSILAILRSAYALFILPSLPKMPKYTSTVSGSWSCSALYGVSKPEK